MYPRLRTLIRVDLATNSAVLHITGHFTTINYQALIPVIRRAHALPGNPRITIDVTCARSVDPAAASLLEDACLTLTSPTALATVPVHFVTATKAISASAIRHTGENQDIGHIVGMTRPTPPVPVAETTAAYTLAS